jgi:hypothetical protein
VRLPGRLVVLAALCLSACAQQAATDAPIGDAVFLVGQVRDVRDGVEPLGVPVDDEDLDDEGSPESGGSLAVRPDDEDEPRGLDACRLEGDVHTVYYTRSTDFDPPQTVDDRRFPERLQNSNVTVSGLVYALDVADEISGCTIVANRIDVQLRSRAAR